MASSIINSDDGSVSGTTGLKTTGGDDGELAFESSGTEAMRIDSSGNVGIGTSSPTSYTGQTNLNINSSGVSRIDFDISDALQGYVLAESGYIGLIANTGNYLMLGANNTERMRIDSSGNLKFNSGYGSVATAYGCRAWVNFNGTGTVAIRESGNVSSITDFDTGGYIVNFTTAMPDADYATNITISGYTGSGDSNADGFARSLTTSSVSVRCAIWGTGYYDQDLVCVSIFR